MRWSPSLLLPLCLFTTACGTSAKHQALLERRAAIRESNEAHGRISREVFRSKTGFQNTLWGMTREEVRARAPQSFDFNAWGDLRDRGFIAGRPVLIDYVFAQGQLAEVVLHIRSPGAVRGNFNEMAELLTMKYGKPVDRLDSELTAQNRLAMTEMLNNLSAIAEDIQVARSGRRSSSAVDTYALRREASARDDVVLAANDYILQSTWKAPETDLVLTGNQEPGLRVLTLRYQGVWMKRHLSQELAVRTKQEKAQQSREL
ncbi:hypothetical protein ACLEPN_20300 [Myxococcus sp. 1LA]